MAWNSGTCEHLYICIIFLVKESEYMNQHGKPLYKLPVLTLFHMLFKLCKIISKHAERIVSDTSAKLFGIGFPSAFSFSTFL